MDEEKAESILEMEMITIESQTPSTVQSDSHLDELTNEQSALELTRDGKKMEMSLETITLVDRAKRAAINQLKYGEYFLHIMLVCFLKFLSNPIFRALSPYTYGVYLFHTSLLGLATKSKIITRVDAILSGMANGAVDSCSALEVAGYKYDWMFVFTESIIVLWFTLILAVTLHWIVEKPIMWFRKQWLPRKVATDSPTT